MFIHWLSWEWWLDSHWKNPFHLILLSMWPINWSKLSMGIWYEGHHRNELLTQTNMRCSDIQRFYYWLVKKTVCPSHCVKVIKHIMKDLQHSHIKPLLHNVTLTISLKENEFISGKVDGFCSSFIIRCDFYVMTFPAICY